MNWKIKFLATSTIVIGVIVFIGIHHVAPYAIVQPQRINEELTPDKLDLESEDLGVKGIEDIELNGYWIKSKQDSAKGVIILVHGIGGCKEHFLNLSKELSELGIETIIFDGRAHGKSGGKYCTYGFKEKEDISKIVDEVENRNPNFVIGIWGNSLGGAIAIQALEFDERIDFGIIESTFTELDKIIYDYKKRILHGIGLKMLSDYALKRAGEIANFDPGKVKPVESVKNIEQPILISHGDSDKNISIEYGRELFENLKSSDKELVVIEGAGHFDLFIKGGDKYKVKIIKFIERNFE